MKNATATPDQDSGPDEIREHYERVARDVDSVPDDEVLRKLNYQLHHVRGMAEAVLVYIDRLAHSENMTDGRREDVGMHGRLHLLDLIGALDQAEETTGEVSYRLRHARKGQPDPSTLTFDERMRERIQGVLDLAAEWGIVPQEEQA